jgi:hypothetical protein
LDSIELAFRRASDSGRHAGHVISDEECCFAFDGVQSAVAGGREFGGLGLDFMPPAVGCSASSEFTQFLLHLVICDWCGGR